MKQISASELRDLMQTETDLQIIDIRDTYEFDFSNLGDSAKSIPMAEILDHLSEIITTGKVVMHCRSGNRSEAMIDYLEVHHKFQNLHNLTGGILAWSEEVDTSIIPC